MEYCCQSIIEATSKGPNWKWNAQTVLYLFIIVVVAALRWLALKASFLLSGLLRFQICQQKYLIWLTIDIWLSYDARRKFEEHNRRKRVARGAAKSNFSQLYDIQLKAWISCRIIASGSIELLNLTALATNVHNSIMMYNCLYWLW